MPPKPRATKGPSKGKGPKVKTEVSEEARAAAAAAKEIGNKHFAAQKYDDAAKVSAPKSGGEIPPDFDSTT